MALSNEQQAASIIKEAKNILIAFPAHHGANAVGSALAMALFLEKLKKRVDIVSTGFVVPMHLKFLPQINKITAQISALRKFIISLNLSKTKLNDLSYSVENDKLHIYLTPKEGSFSATDLTTRASDFAYDLIITVDTPDLESLGELYHNNTEFFFQTTILNIDHTAANEQYGQINIINLNTPSTADIMYNLLQALNVNLIDADIATCLFTGITNATKSFTTIEVTPTSLSHAAALVNMGARREEVVTNLYRTKQLATLKLWGRALARLKHDPQRKLVWTLLQPDDFIKASAHQDVLPGIIDELISNAPEAGTVILLYEAEAGTTQIFMLAGPGQHALDLLKPWNPTGDRTRANAVINKTVLEAEKEVIERAKTLMKPLE